MQYLYFSSNVLPVPLPLVLIASAVQVRALLVRKTRPDPQQHQLDRRHRPHRHLSHPGSCDCFRHGRGRCKKGLFFPPQRLRGSPSFVDFTVALFNNGRGEEGVRCREKTSQRREMENYESSYSLLSLLWETDVRIPSPLFYPHHLTLFLPPIHEMESNFIFLAGVEKRDVLSLT